MSYIEQSSALLRLTRRELFRALLGIATYLPAPLLLAAGKHSPEVPKAPPALGPFVDTLLPEDGTPSATQVGVDSEILRQMTANPRMSDVIVMGCLWLDQQADKLGAADFAALDPGLRVKVAGNAELASKGSLPRVFFDGVLDIALRHYYAQPSTWPGLGYSGPPQPHGFMDFSGPPSGSDG